MMGCDHLQSIVLGAVGAEIVGIDVSQPISEACRYKILQSWKANHVLLFRNQSLTEESLLKFAYNFGDPKPAGSRGYYMRAGNPHGSGRTSDFPHVSVMSNMDENGNPVPVTGGHGSQFVDWHQDDSYTNHPARGALLYNTAHPVNGGGNTSFCNLYKAYESLPPELKRLIDQLHLVHDISRNSAGHVRPGLELPQAWEDVVGPAHPLVITHQQRRALHLGRKQPPPTSYILEIPDSLGHSLFDYLWEWSTQPDFVWTHDTWSPGDLLLWDNLATMHLRSAVDPLQKREMLRVLLRGGNLTGVDNRTATIPTNANDRANVEAAIKDKLEKITSNASAVCERTKVGAAIADCWDETLTASNASAVCEAVPKSSTEHASDWGGVVCVAILIVFWCCRKHRKRTPSERYLNEPRIQCFWVCFLAIFLKFQSFSCGRADRLWRISDVYRAAPPVLLKPYGVSFLFFEPLSKYMRGVENTVLVCLVALSLPPRVDVPRRWLALVAGLGFLYLHAYEHSLTGGSHTHLMPAICMMALALPPRPSLAIIQQWNVFLLFSAGICKLFNGDHHPWWAWMDGQSMQFYFENSRQAVPEPWNSWTMEHSWFAALQSSGSVLFELSTPLLLYSGTYRRLFPFFGAAFHGMIWYTLGVNYFTSVVIQFCLVLDSQDWLHTLHRFRIVKRTESFDTSRRVLLSGGWERLLVAFNALLLLVVIVQQIEFWPLSNIPMYSGYRPKLGYNTTHIANRSYLDNLIRESAPHVWSRHWTDVMVINLESNERSKLTFCADSRVVVDRGVRDVCLIPEGNLFDTERHDISAGDSFRLVPPSRNVPHSMRPGGWNRQKPIVVMASLPGRYHVYCRNTTISPAEDWLFRNCAFLRSMGLHNVSAELVVHLGTGGDLIVGSVDCAHEYIASYHADRVPQCIQSPWEVESKVTSFFT